MSKSRNKIKISLRGGSLGLAMKEQNISAHSLFGKKLVKRSDILKAKKVAEQLMNKVEMIPHPTQNHGYVLVHGFADSGIATL